MHFLASDASALPLASESFDAIISIGLVEYVWPDRRVLREFARVLRPGGVAVVAFPHQECVAWRLEVATQRTFQRAPRDIATMASAIPAAEHPRASEFNRAMSECGFDFAKGLFCYPQLLSWPLRQRMRFLDTCCAYLDPVIGKIRWLGRIYVSRWQRR